MGQIRPSSGSQPTVAMPSVAEADHAEFAETAATLAPQIERFFYTRERSGGPNFPSTVPPPEGRPRAHVPATLAALAWGVVRFPLWLASLSGLQSPRPASVILMRTTSTALRLVGTTLTAGPPVRSEMKPLRRGTSPTCTLKMYDARRDLPNITREDNK
jgi:hypothetical protein